MKVFRKILVFTIAILMILPSLVSCTEEKVIKTNETVTDTKVTENYNTEINVIALKGPTGMGMAKLITDSNGDENSKYNFTLSSAPDEVTAALISKTADIAAIPSNLAANLYKKTDGDIMSLAINTLGVLYILENGNTIQSLADLKGKTIYVTGQASTPEYALRYVLSKNGIDPDKDVTIVYQTEHSELATLMTSGDVVLGMLPEPFVSAVLASNSNVRIAIDLTKEWQATDDGTLIMGSIVVRREFAEKHKEAVDEFLEKYKASVEYVNENIDESSQMIEDLGIVAKAAIAKKALPNCNITYIDGDEMKENLKSFYQVLYAANPSSVGGSLPDDNFYYKK